MAHIVTANCHDCKYTDCCVVCPVECFYQDENMLYIDPNDCIDCEACVPECPVEAIYSEDDVPDDQKGYIALNAELAKQWKPIVERKDPLPDADHWARIKGKLGELKR